MECYVKGMLWAQYQNGKNQIDICIEKGLVKV